MALIKGIYRVSIAGQDVTSRMSPYLLQLSVSKAAGQASDTANMTLADPDGRIFLPSARADVSIHLNGVEVFIGFVDDVTSNIDKGGGRTMEISASSVDQGGKAKEPSLKHKDDASLADAAKHFGGPAGISMQVSGSIAGIKRKYWLQQNESFMSWGQRTARETGATFKVIGNRGFLTARNEGLSISGRPLTSVNVAGGSNLISGNIKPIISRPKFNKVGISYFDIKKGEKVEVEVSGSVTGVEAKLRSTVTSFDKDQAKEKGEALSKESERDQGQGSVTIIGNAAAEPEAEAHVSGFRSGVDGTYRIHSVSHSVSKSGGFTTSLELRQPKGGAGTDKRTARPASATSLGNAPSTFGPS